MTEEEINIIRQFVGLANSLQEATGTGQYGGAPQRARGKVQEWVSRFNKISIKPESYMRPDDEDIKAAELVKASFRAQFEERGKAETKEALLKAADDVDTIAVKVWAILPNVLMEANRIAAELRKEAEADDGVK